MLQQVIEKIKDKTEDTYIFDNGYMAKVHEVDLVDIQTNIGFSFEKRISNFFSEAKPDEIYRFILRSQNSVTAPQNINLYKRHEAILSYGFLEKKGLISVEKKMKPSLRNIFSSKKKPNENYLSVENFEALGLRHQPYYYEQTYKTTDRVRASKSGLLVNDHYVATLTLHKLSQYPIEVMRLMSLQSMIAGQYEIVLTASKVDERQTKLLLDTKSKQNRGSRSYADQTKEHEAQLAIEEVELYGKELVSFDFTINLFGFDEDELVKRSFELKRVLSGIGDFKIETFGAFECFKASQIGGGQHISHTEMSSKLATYIPFLQNGNYSRYSENPLAFYFHRDDYSVDGLDIYEKNYDNYSGIIVGKSGRGKSVFVNNLLRCLNYDKRTHIILVDVKGSHSKTVEELGGTHHQITNTEPCGISPFDFIKNTQSLDVAEILTDFLEKLVLDVGEFRLLKEEKAQISTELLRYMESKTNHPSLDDFLKFSKNLPRSKSFNEWSTKGLYGSIFYPHQNIGDNRLHYFNFKDILTASNTGVGQSVMSAVMAHFNYILMNKNPNDRLIFIADETPFFVKSCFQSFSLLVKNVRKLGGSLILVSQNLSDLVVDGDYSLISQTEFKVLFSKDTGFTRFQKVLDLSDESDHLLGQFSTSKDSYSEFLIKDSMGERHCKLILSKEEYYRSTTHPEDVNKINGFRDLFSIKSDNELLSALKTLRDYHGLSL